MKAGALSFAGVLVVGNAFAAPASKCAKPDEVTSIQAAAVQQELMVAALTCDQIANFNAFQTGFGPELRSSDATLHKMFKRIFGRAGEDQFHAFKTRLANNSSIRSIHDNAGYCQEASGVFSSALAAAKPTLAAFVSSISMQDTSPVDSCEIRVAVSLKGAATGSFILPRPKPMVEGEVAPAIVAPAPAAPVSPAPQAQ